MNKTQNECLRNLRQENRKLRSQVERLEDLLERCKKHKARPQQTPPAPHAVVDTPVRRQEPVRLEDQIGLLTP